jgi:hypothetical protein
MPVNYTQFQQQLREKGQQAKAQERDRRERLERAQTLLDEHANDLDALRELIAEAARSDRGLRCASPLREPLTFAGGADPPAQIPVLLAADGSQVNPSRHDAVEFGLINIGLIRMTPGQAQAPREIVFSTLLLFDDLRSPEGPLTEDLVALRRDLYERTRLAEAARSEPQPVVALTDGPLELFGEPKDDARYQETFNQYLDALEQTASMNVVTAGYVDKPRADLLVRLLELSLSSPENLRQAGRERPLFGVTDNQLFEDRLQPGERSAVFAIQSSSAEKFRQRSAGLALHFFYLNAGRPGRPWLARVEIPAWVSRQPEMIDLLQHTLLQQCAQLGGRPYPYALHRAHEIAVVSFQEKEQLSVLIEAELRRQGVEVGQKSNKQATKDLEGRTRYGA